MNANVSTNTTYTITSGVYTADVVSLAADFVSGTYKDYYLFQYTQNDYVFDFFSWFIYYGIRLYCI